jgi:uncharacterized membrane protein
MTTIVAFSVTSRDRGEEALERLEGVARDVALVYKSHGGKVTVQQCSDLTVGHAMLRGALLGAAVSIFAGPLVGMAATGGAAGAAYGGLRDNGVSERVMKLAGTQLEAGEAAVFVLAGDDLARAIESAVRESGVADIEVGSFPASAESVVTETLRLS